MFDVVPAKKYYTDLQTAVGQATTRIVLSAMTLRADPNIQTLLGTVAAAAERGVRVLIVADHYSFYGAGRPESVSRHDFAVALKATRAIAQHLSAAGVQLHWVGNANQLSPYTGRYHAKISVIDNTVWSFGGTNLSDDAFTNIDYMLHCQDEGIANALERLVLMITKNQPHTDYSQPLNGQDTLLFDAGVSGKSIIYSTACALTAQATRVYYVSQMCPSGQLAKLLGATNATCYFNRPAATGLRAGTLAQAWDNWRTGIQNYYKSKQYLHAKCILFELNDGAKVVLSGSHNFSYRGVAFGTKEIALKSTDGHLWQQLYDQIVQPLATAGELR